MESMRGQVGHALDKSQFFPQRVMATFFDACG
jgi:hypothetical protein